MIISIWNYISGITTTNLSLSKQPLVYSLSRISYSYVENEGKTIDSKGCPVGEARGTSHLSWVFHIRMLFSLKSQRQEFIILSLRLSSRTRIFHLVLKSFILFLEPFKRIYFLYSHTLSIFHLRYWWSYILDIKLSYGRKNWTSNKGWCLCFIVTQCYWVTQVSG